MIAPETYVGAALAANAIWSLLDQRRYEDILPYLTPDCAWQRPEGWRRGHGDVRASFLARPADLLSRHVVTNFTAEQADDGSLKGRCYVTAYFARTEDLHATQLMGQPYILGDVDLEFVQSDQSVLIARISVHSAFAIQALIK
jgi:hypothetical protein